MKAVLSATMPPSVRGTGFAISALTQGIALGAGNYMAGRLCDIFGSAGAFWGGGAFATAARIRLAAFMIYQHSHDQGGLEHSCVQVLACHKL